MVAQLVLDALGRWAERATGLRALHGKTGTDRLDPPYVALEWRRRPAPKSPRHETELAAAPLGGRVTLTAAEGGWSTLTVNLGRVSMQRGVGEGLDELATRAAALLRPMVAGRVVVTTDGAAVVAAPVVVGDLWRVSALEGAVAAYEGGEAAARIVDRVWSSVVRVRVVGARATSGAAGQAGDGAAVPELLAALQDALDVAWCRELFDCFGIRRTEEASEAPADERRTNATLEDRSYFDLVLGVSTRHAEPAEPATVVVVGYKLDQDPAPNPAPHQIEVTIDGNAP